MIKIFIERTRRHTKINALLILKKQIDSHPEQADLLRKMTEGDFERIFSSPAVRVKVADALINGFATRHQEFFQRVTYHHLEFQSAPSSSTVFLSASPELQWIIDSKQYEVEPNTELVRKQWALGLHLIEQLKMSRLLEIVDCVDLVVGLQYEWGAIRAFSNPKFPGFIAINVNAPAVIMAEQMIHESMHVAIASALELETDYQGLTDSTLASFSPFADSVRTLDRVVHGFLSYFAVHKFWSALKQSDEKKELELLTSAFAQGGDYREIIHKRLAVIHQRLQAARLFLDDAMSSEISEKFIRLFHEFFPGDDDILVNASSRNAIINNAGYQRTQELMSPIARAEVELARAGNKVSRVSVSMGSVSTQGFSLAMDGPVVPASWVVCPVKDDRLDGFSNLSSAERSVLQAEPGDDVHLYISKTPELARQAAKLDMQGDAGGLFKIPECCRNWFAKRWHAHVALGGDLFAVMINDHQKNNRLKVAKECDVSAMFRGGGLCWHFPCSPTCGSTIQIIRERLNELSRINPELLSELQSIEVKKIWLDEDGRYLTQVSTENGMKHILVEFI